MDAHSLPRNWAINSRSGACHWGRAEPSNRHTFVVSRREFLGRAAGVGYSSEEIGMILSWDSLSCHPCCFASRTSSTAYWCHDTPPEGATLKTPRAEATAE